MPEHSTASAVGQAHGGQTAPLGSGALVEAWRTWDRYPGAEREAVAFETAVAAFAGEVGLRTGQGREMLAGFRRAGCSYVEAIELAREAARSAGDGLGAPRTDG